MRVVVDTNVWVSGLIAPDSPPGYVLQAVRDERVTLVSSWELVDEIVEVLRRPKLGRYKLTPEDIDDVLIVLAPALPVVELDVPLRDPKDVPVVAAALAGGAQAIVTGDADLLDDADVRSWLSSHGIDVLTPADLAERLSASDR